MVKLSFQATCPFVFFSVPSFPFQGPLLSAFEDLSAYVQVCFVFGYASVWLELASIIRFYVLWDIRLEKNNLILSEATASQGPRQYSPPSQERLPLKEAVSCLFRRSKTDFIFILSVPYFFPSAGQRTCFLSVVWPNEAPFSEDPPWMECSRETSASVRNHLPPLL